ncbi:Cyclin family protein [Rhynchospora pubera]|uniref:Cyclin family protein n=1 Tax=Rhynchospora pubera TaxID=906938 RepID=A0AAV8F753_9POAL|nr:Cyclin family protein [Rhynchospora pubera]
MTRLMEVRSNLLNYWFKRLSISLGCQFPSFNFCLKHKVISKQNATQEVIKQPCNYLSSQSSITPKVRASLVNLIVELHQMLQFCPETLYLTVAIFDRFLSQETVARVEGKLVGMCAMLIASKYEEVHKPLLEELADIWMLRYVTGDVVRMEKRILHRLEWSLNLPTTYMFLSRWINIEQPDEETECMIYFFSELALTQHYLIRVCPSRVAASCVYAARCTLKKYPLWTKTLQQCTRYLEPQLLECTQILVDAHSLAPKCMINAVYEKYSLEEYRKVALHAPVELEQLPLPVW